MADYLPEEVVVDILTRLPVKEILKSRSVCKSWYSLISTKAFQSYHLNKSVIGNNILVLLWHGIDKNQEQYSLCLDDDDDFPRNRIQELDSPFEPVIGEYAALRIVGCCNGVVCFTDNLSSVHRASLWNPCIRKLVEIPLPIAFPKRLTSCLDAVGFGFDALNDDYKLVRVSTHLRRQFVEVYSLSSGVWRMVDHELDCSIRCHSSSVHINGVCYWVANGRRPCYSNMVVSFALATEVFDEMPPLPDELVKGYNKNMALAASNKGLLSLMSVENVCFGERVLDRATIWVMENGCWVKVMVWESPYSVCKLLTFKDNGVVLFAATASRFHTDEHLVRYDPNTRESVKLIPGRLHLNVNYFESLSLLQGDVGS